MDNYSNVNVPILQIGSDSDSYPSSSDEEFTFKYINVISSKKPNEKELLLELIERIDDPQLKRRYLSQLRELITEENHQNLATHTTDIAKIYSKHAPANILKGVTTKDLHTEISSLKSFS
jgi:hypothetical protein